MFISIYLLLIAPVINAQQYTLTDDDVVVEKGVIKSCSYNFAIKNIIIPSVLDGQTVIAIETYGPASNTFIDKGITGLVLPATLKKIGYEEFKENKIKKVIIPEEVEIIGGYAFHKNDISEIVLPDNLKKIEDYAFWHNEISELDLNDNLEYLGEGAFCRNNLTSVVVPGNIGILRTHSFSYNNISHLTIKEGVKAVQGHACFENPFETVLLPNSVTNIGIYAFHSTKPLKITLPTPVIEGVSEIVWIDNGEKIYNSGDEVDYDSSFYRIKREYTLTDDDVVVNDGVLISCRADLDVSELIIPDELDGQRIKVVGDNVFEFKGLLSVKLPSELETIGMYAFHENHLLSVDIPKGVNSIGRWAFFDNELKSVIVPDKVKVIEDYTFAGNRIDYLELPYGLEDIEYFAFGNNFLRKYNIPETVKKIDKFALRGIFLETIILHTAVKSGYEFVYWVDNNGKTYNAGEEVTAGDVSYEAVFNKAINATAVDKLDAGSVQVYPNPVRSKLNIEVDVINEAEYILICDLTGKVFDKIYFDKSDIISVDVNEYPKGMLLIHIKCTDGIITKKVVKI